MKKYIICLLVALTLTPLTYGQRYQGSVSVAATGVGAVANLSNGVMFNKDYVGLGVEYGEWWLLLIAREWGAVYADYRHHFKIGEKSSFFLQASPGLGYSDTWIIGDEFKYREKGKPEPEDDKFLFYGKAGAGFAWQFRKCGLAVSIQNSFFAPTRLNCYMPSLQFSFLW